MTTRLTNEFRRRLMYGSPGDGLGEVSVTIQLVSARRVRGVGRAVVRITLTDKKGREMAELTTATVEEGADIVLTDLHRCFDIRIS